VTLEDVIGEAIKILAASGVGWPALIAAVVLLAFAIVAFKRIRIPGDPESMKPKPDATWGDNVKPDGGPPGGGMEGG
jgi:hypothetical protein